MHTGTSVIIIALHNLIYIAGSMWYHILFCFSVFYVSDGNKMNKKRKVTKSSAKTSAEIKKYCRAMVWFDKRQRHMCGKQPELIEIVQKGVQNALTECRRQFKTYRWNCSPLTWTQVFSEDGILKKRKFDIFICV